MLNSWEESGKLTGNEYIVKTIVTSYLLDKIAASKNVECYNVLTGFKYIGALMTQMGGEKTFIAGGEESYGYLVGEHARDKDAVIACAMIAEITAYYKNKGSSLFNAMLEMYEEYGLYKVKLISITKKGKSGAEEIGRMMEEYRNNPPRNLGDSRVVTVKDYQAREELDLSSGKKKAIELPASNVLQFITDDGSIISARPSGTEPKIKFYCNVNINLPNKSEYYKVSEILDRKIDAIMKSLGM